MDTIPTPEAGLSKAIDAVKTASALARSLNITPSAVLQWDKVPADRLGEVSRITGIPAEELRPDLAALFAPSKATPEGEVAR